MEQYVELEEAHQMLICRLCTAAVRPGRSIEPHFRREHQLKGQILHDIRDYYSSMQLSDPKTAELPADRTAAIQPLKVVYGYSCTACRYLTRTRDNITRHWRTAGHGVAETRWTQVRLQTWLHGSYARYWIVKDGAERQDEERVTSDSAAQKMIAEFTAELEAEDKARLRQGDVEEGLDRDSAWVKRVGWVRHFGSRDKLEVYRAAEWIKAKEAKGRWHEAENEDVLRERTRLARLAGSFDREVERCCWRLDSVPIETLQWLAGISSTTTAGVPFGRKGKEASMNKYRSVGQRYLGFCLRLHQAGREQAFERWAVSFTDEQWSLLGDVMYELGEAESCSQDSGYFSDGEDGEEDDGGEVDEGLDDDDAAEGDEPTAESKATERLDRAVFLFMVASIKQKVGGRAYANPLLCFCAALGITARPLGYTEPHLYTGLLAGVLWWSRLFFLEAGFEGQSRELEEVGVEAVLAFQEELAKWMVIGTHTVASTVIGWMAYGKGWRQRMGGQPTVRWSEDGQTLFHNGEGIAIEDFRRTARELVTSGEGLLDGLMAGSWAGASKGLDMKRIADNMVRVGAGQSFTTNPQNKWLDAGPGKVMRLVGPSVWDAARNRWKLHGAKRWLRRLRIFKETLMVLTHIWGGQPGRGPELMTLRHSDSWQLIRNIFVLDGQVMIITDRDKMKALRDNGRKVARFLPDRVGRMVVAYIAWLLPFERMLRRRCRLPEPHGERLDHMWRDGDSRVWETAQLSAAMARMLQAGTGVRIGVARYRPIAIEIGRRIRGLVMRQAEASAGDDDGDDDVDVDPLTGEPVDVGGGWNIVWDLQATHGTMVARQHYAVHIGFPGKLQPEMIATFREISGLWHQFLNGEESTDGLKRKRATQDSIAATEKRARGVSINADTVDEAELTAGLRAVLGPGATWRSEKQAESMRAIMQLGPEESMISVLPTGAGKSILFMVPAVMASTGTSIVVVPFVSLMEDLVERATSMGVDCIRYRPSLSAGRDGLQRAARLVVASADLIATPEFTAYADGLASAGLLRRIFVDECHTVMTDAGYRPKLEELKSLHRFGCSLVMLTATMPVVLEEWFRGLMLASSAVMVRDRTAKLNCRYRVEQIKPGKGAVAARTVEAARQMGGRMTGRQKGVIYCRSTRASEGLAEELGCDFHHSGMPEQRNREVREAWASGEGHRWITATTGLGTGIDIEGIVAVIHMEQPYGLVDFVQQTGRGARRQGEVVESVVIHDGRPPREDAHCDFVSSVNQAQMAAFMATPGCRRAVISAFMDGLAGETCASSAGAEMCDRCTGHEAVDNGRSERPGRRADMWKAFGQEEGRRVRTLLRWLDEVADECAVCHVRRHQKGLQLESVPDEPRHREEGKWCRVVERDRYTQVRRELTFGELACCYKCKLPLDWCGRMRESSGDEECVYADKVLPVVLMVMKSGSLRAFIRESFDVEPNEEEEFLKWLGRNRRFHGTNGTNALAVWEEIIWKVYKEGRYWF